MTATTNRRMTPILKHGSVKNALFSQSVTAVETAMEKTLPVFFVGCMDGLSATMPMQVSALPQTTAENTDADVDWDFLGITYDGAKEVNT